MTRSLWNLKINQPPHWKIYYFSQLYKKCSNFLQIALLVLFKLWFIFIFYLTYLVVIQSKYTIIYAISFVTVTNMVILFTILPVSVAQAPTVRALFLPLCPSRCSTSLQHLPNPECDPSIHGGALYRRQWILQVTPQHHPQRWHSVRLCRYEGRKRRRRRWEGWKEERKKLKKNKYLAQEKLRIKVGWIKVNLFQKKWRKWFCFFYTKTSLKRKLSYWAHNELI